MRTFYYDNRQFKVMRDKRGLVLVAPIRTNDYQPIDVLSAEIQELALAALN